MDGLTVGTGSFVGQPDAMSEALDSQLKFTKSGTGDWWLASGTDNDYYYEADSAQATGTQGEKALLQTIVDSPNSETVKFYWKVSSVQGYDYLQFYIDGTLKDQISGEVAWTQKSYPVSSGIHILKWRFIKNSSGSSGDNCGWVDFVQWTGPSPAQDPSNWQEIAYKHDIAGRRVEKKVDGYSTRYVHDGDHVVAEYDGNNNLLRKYIYGPSTDEPISMIEVAQSNATYYYHFDALGSVVALSNSSGDTIQTYQYSVYGEVAVEDANHTNPYMFTGRRFDVEIGLYYFRARYYNPFTGRFLQTDPIGYADGMNWYAYCTNNPVTRVDPDGTMQKVTGRYWIMPNNLDPNSASTYTFANTLADAIVTIAEVAGIAAGDATPVTAINEILKKMAEEVGKNITITGWRAFIEVQDCCDTNQNYHIEDKELMGSPYWIEIISICSGSAAEGNTDKNAWDTGVYLTWGAAADAAGTAIDWAFKVFPGKKPPIAGVIPEDTSFAAGWLADDDDPYVRDKPYRT